MNRIEMSLVSNYDDNVLPCLIETEEGIVVSSDTSKNHINDIKSIYLEITPSTFEERVKLLKELKIKNKRFKSYKNPDVKLVLIEN